MTAEHFLSCLESIFDQSFDYVKTWSLNRRSKEKLAIYYFSFRNFSTHFDILQLLTYSDRLTGCDLLTQLKGTMSEALARLRSSFEQYSIETSSELRNQIKYWIETVRDFIVYRASIKVLTRREVTVIES